jgi:cell division protein FtsQ
VPRLKWGERMARDVWTKASASVPPRSAAASAKIRRSAASASRDGARASLSGSRADPRASTSGSRADARASVSGSRADPRASTREPFDQPRNQRVARPKQPVARAERGAPSAGLGERVAGARARLAALGGRLKRPFALTFKVLFACAALAGAVLLGRMLQHHLVTSPAFAVDRIEIKGLVRMERAELLDAAGLAIGRNVFEHGPGEVKARLLRHPWVAEASVARRLPGSYVIEVRERQPIALLVVEPCHDANLRSETDPTCDDGSALYLLSDDGKLFKRFDAKDPVDLPVITGIDRVRFGSDPEFPKTILLGAAQLLHDYRAQGLAQQKPVSEIHLEPNDGFSLYVGEELTLVRLGAPPYAQKLPKLKKVFARLEREGASAEYVYLDNEQRPDRVTVRLR